MGVQFSLKENRQGICGAQGMVMGCQRYLRQSLAVVVLQLRNARGQAYKRLAMRRDHQCAFRQIQIPQQRSQEQLQWIGFGLAGMDADIGRDAR